MRITKVIIIPSARSCNTGLNSDELVSERSISRVCVRFSLGSGFLYIRACLHGGRGPQVGEVTRLGELKK